MDFAQQVKSTVDIVNVVGDSVRLKKAGGESWVGLCPFHNEKSPSFSVHSRLQIFKCFGCGKAGDVFNFVMEFQGLSFFEALTALAEQNGIPVPTRRDSEQVDQEAQLRDALIRMHEAAVEFFQERLLSSAGEATREYVKRRGLDAEAAAQFQMGYAPAGNTLTGILRSKGFSNEQMTASGLVGKSDDGGYYDRFRERLMFPICDAQGRVIAFGGRALREDQNAKYLNSPETQIYKKSSILYNLHQAKSSMRKQNRVVLAEGYMDVIGIARAGTTDVVATCGTALTPQQVRILRRLVDKVIVNFDSDDAGRNAAEKVVQACLPEGFAVRVLELPAGKDPDDFCREQGGEAYQALVESAPDYYAWLAERARQRFDLSSAEGRVRAFEFLRPSIQSLPDKIQRAAAANDLADRLGVDADLVRQEFMRSAAGGSKSPLASQQAPGQPPSERILFELFLDSPDARAELLERVVELAASDVLEMAGIFVAMHAAELSGDAFEFSAFEARLNEKDRETAARIVFAPDRGEQSLEDGRRAYSALRRRSIERRYRAVRREMVEAERAGDRKRALDLITQRSELTKQLAELDGGTAAS